MNEAHGESEHLESRIEKDGTHGYSSGLTPGTYRSASRFEAQRRSHARSTTPM